MRRFHARELAAMPKAELWEIPQEKIIVVFDDGEVECWTSEALYSAYMWGFYVDFPETPALKKHHLGKRRIGTSTHLNMINEVRWDCHDAYDGQIRSDILNKKALEYINIAYNDLSEGSEAWATTLSQLDINAVMHHPEIKAANEQVTIADKTIVHAHRTIERVLKDAKELVGNSLALAVQCGLVKLGQVLQMIGPRGSVTDNDSNIFPYPVQVGFAQGLYRFYDSFIESRTASKSLTFTEKPLQDTEYFNRKLQLLAATLRDLYDGDCGTEQYLLWQMGPGDLEAFKGKYYLKDDGTLGMIQNNDECRKELVGKSVRIRSPLYCATLDSTMVCTTCYGEMEKSIPHGTNIGHVAATALCKQASQRVLSTKHLDASASSSGLRLSEFEQRYVRLGNDPNLLFLAHRLAEGAKIKLYISADEAERIAEVKSAENVEILLPSHISALTQVTFVVTKNGKEEAEVVQVSNGSRTSSLSREMLVHLRTHGWKLLASDRGGSNDIEIDLTEWDPDQPLFATPRRQENMLDYMATIEKFLKAAKKGSAHKSLKDFMTVDGAARGLYDLVSSRLFVNFVHLEILVKVCQVRSTHHRDSRIPLIGNKVEFGRFDFTIFSRSAGASMAYQNHRQQWNSPTTYLTHLRPPHPLDPILMPLPQTPSVHWKVGNSL